MTAQPTTEQPIPEGWTRGPDGRPVPPAPTDAEIAEAAERRRRKQEEAERASQEAFAARHLGLGARLTARADRLARLAEEELVKAGKPTGVVGESGEYDENESAASVRAEAWAKDLEIAKVMHLAGWTIGDIQDARVKALIEGFLGQIGRHKTHLLLTGNTGAGKTACLIGAGHHTVQAGHNTRFVTHKAFVATMTARGLSSADRLARKTYFDRLARVPVLALDDLGAGMSPTKAVPDDVASETLDLISSRWGSGLTTMVTTNFSSEAIQTMFGDQLLSRLGADSVVVEFKGPDLRAPASWGGGKSATGF